MSPRLVTHIDSQCEPRECERPDMAVVDALLAVIAELEASDGGD